ncbi:hypothetical protein BDW62DRAFT_103431 [Aspergillus aurantiobrunneus]
MGTPGMNPATLCTGADIFRFPLPELLTREGYQTTSSALHNLQYHGPLGDWQIEEEAHNIVFASHLKKNLLSVHMSGISNHQFSINNEHHLCGDEQSVCGRFVQNALGPATAVAFADGIYTRFGDFNVSAGSPHTIAKANEKNKKGGGGK